jgi:hypothetical protein
MQEIYSIRSMGAHVSDTSRPSLFAKFLLLSPPLFYFGAHWSYPIWFLQPDENNFLQKPIVIEQQTVA